jgi:acyl-coenzyme A thioesterase PaaI-like protein
MSQTLSMYQSVGPSAFSNMACQMAPYFGTINPEISVLVPGRGEVKVPFRKEITNHLASIHAIALCNAAELAGGMMTEVSIPSGARWIPKGMTVEYLAKAKTSIHAIADGSEIDWETSGDKVVPVDIFDEGGVKVFTARITMNVKVG